MLTTYPADADHQWLLRSVEAHRDAVATGRGVLKNEYKTTITRVRCDDRTAVIKHYRWMGTRAYLKGLIKRHPSERSRRASELLEQRSIGTPKILGLVVRSVLGLTAEAWLVAEDIEGAVEMDRYMVRRLSPPRTRVDRQAFCRAFAETLGQLLRRGIRHRDLKTCNILVVEKDAGWQFSFIDLDYVQIVGDGSPIARPDWLQALSHLNSSTPKFVSWTERLRFIEAIPELGALDRRDLIQDVQRISRGRGRVYIDDDGPVELEFE
jgi:tRNA A-37 threonylcarbamoyl transferase component Bud32